MKKSHIEVISVFVSSIIAILVINVIFNLLENTDVNLKITFISICAAAGSIKMTKLLNKYER